MYQCLEAGPRSAFPDPLKGRGGRARTPGVCNKISARCDRRVSNISRCHALFITRPSNSWAAAVSARPVQRRVTSLVGRCFLCQVTPRFGLFELGRVNEMIQSSGAV